MNQLYRQSRCGYYGAYGAYVIKKTLYHMLLTEPKLLVKKDSAPLSPKDYLQFVLLPEVACRLIAQDRQVSLVDALDIMRSSTDFGELVFEDDDSSEE